MTDPAAPKPTPIWARSDTMFGVCHGLGEELGIHANWLRIALALGLFWSPLAVVATYVAAGLLLAVFRWTMPFRAPAAAATPAPVLHGDNDDAPVARSEAA